MDDGEDAELARLDWIVWPLEVRDPKQRAAHANLLVAGSGAADSYFWE